MSRYLKERVSVVEFDGDKVRVTVRALELTDLLSAKSLETEEDLVRWGKERLPTYVTSLEGLADATGQPLTIEDVVGSAYFMPLVVELAGKLVETATLENPSPPSAPLP